MYVLRNIVLYKFKAYILFKQICKITFSDDVSQHFRWKWETSKSEIYNIMYTNLWATYVAKHKVYVDKHSC